MQIEVQILRGRGYPQTEEEPYPCTTQVIISVFSPDLKAKLVNDQCSSIQKNSNAPFYNDELKFLVPNEGDRAVAILAKIIKFSQDNEPFDLFYGRFDVSREKFRSKKEVVIPLFLEEPAAPDASSSEKNVAYNDSENQQPSLSVRVRTHQVISSDTPEESEELNAIECAALYSSDILVPSNCEFVWFRFLRDKKWNHLFRFHLLATWRDHSAQKSNSENKGKFCAPSKADSNDLQTIGDVVVKRWCCSRIHAALSKICLTAEKFCCGETNLLISNGEEENFCTLKKRRSALLSSLWYDSFKSYGSEALRECLENLWILFTTGTDPDSSSTRNLSYELRRKVHSATFDIYNAALLLSSLLHLLIPSISYETAQMFAINDIRSKNAFRGFILEDSAALKILESESKVNSHQVFFFAVLLFFIAPLMDTITEAESVKALKSFKAAIVDAHKHNSESAKEFIKGKIGHDSLASRHYLLKGDGIPIDHLDKLGHRRVSLKFT